MNKVNTHIDPLVDWLTSGAKRFDEFLTSRYLRCLEAFVDCGECSRDCALAQRRDEPRALRSLESVGDELRRNA